MTAKNGFLALSIVLAILPMGAARGTELSDADLAARLESFLATAAGEGFSGAVLLARNHKVILEKGFGVADPSTGAKVEAGG